MASQEEQQPGWSNLPSDLLRLIAQRSRDAVTGLAAFRSVCRTWRAAVGPAPRLLLPRAGSASDPTLVFPLARGWSIVVDARDASCHLSHLATGAAAALPKLTNAVRDIYGHRPDAVRSWAFHRTYAAFTYSLRFAIHVPPDDSDPTAAAAGMTVMMYHLMHGRTGMLFCRPGDAAWTKVKKPNPLQHGCLRYGFFDFVYHDGKMFGMGGTNGQMAVYDAATLDVLHVVPTPPVPSKLSSKMYGRTTKMYGVAVDLEDYDYINLVSLPSKLILVMTSVKSSLPVAFNIFELRSTPDGGLTWHK
ncbi:hypothetical protein HU200_006600 [Digitaria exilis]|uniref:F-box domain-containing protein n=1 Tax=Digitaria exilis TaxID=1010633 RepID=A0A835FPZ0_9POAL|nr:hypothetical protein HU200_006600 [Digitaria exilis]